MARRQELDHGPTTAPSRRGELSADALLAVALEEGGPLPKDDVGALAAACDIQLAELELAESSAPVTPVAP
jgi:hypothetical protein